MLLWDRSDFEKLAKNVLVTNIRSSTQQQKIVWYMYNSQNGSSFYTE
jgi:hypothetical protein